MKLTIQIDLRNAAFDGAGTQEVHRILKSVASRLPEPLDETGGTLSLHDSNGNYCGTAEITEDKTTIYVLWGTKPGHDYGLPVKLGGGTYSECFAELKRRGADGWMNMTILP